MHKILHKKKTKTNNFIKNLKINSKFSIMKQKSSNQIISPKLQKYYCENCDYNTSRLSNWKKHIKTKKHRVKPNRINCGFCGELFGSRTTLWRHKKKCKKNIVSNENCYFVSKVSKNVSKISSNNSQNGKKTVKNGNIIFEQKNEKVEKNGFFEVLANNTEIQIGELKNLMKDLIISQNQLQKNMETYIRDPKIINNNNCNNSMTINMFLNNDCKNAINLADFVDNVKISWDDLDYTKTNGYVNGISNIFFKQLKDLKPTERPIHCSDHEKLQFYFKDANKWEKDTQNKKMNESIKTITRKQMIQIKEWEQTHPKYTENQELLEEWHQMILCLMGGQNENEIQINQEEIKKKIGGVVNIDHLNKDKS